MKVLVSDNLSQKGVEILKKAGLDVEVKIGMKPDEPENIIITTVLLLDPQQK
jgi:D-3-phosphoglycerate dehydrogenase